ncbi:hypothetical protein [Frigidibacter mobilis]|uniref:Uncharacterized protein n=1 Tax=Frigidibacter mobilis TaxID=1335048 RepID=A0A159Z5R6_9RHOB|nr:hypothetical protein [Frigidibacter mobilis]AMY69768.1 hypothetical protein AKL17_2525 [Frigidibacter mobilis]
MNLNQIVSMILNTLMRKAVNKGVNAGMGHLGKGKKPAGTAAKTSASNGQTVAQSKAGRDLAKRARQAAQVTRRLGR